MVAQKSHFFLSLIFFLFSSCSFFSSYNKTIVEHLIITPDPHGPQDFINSITKAKKSIWMKMYHLSDPDVVEALLSAHKKQIDIKIILDNRSLQESKFQKAYGQLKDAGIDVRASSICFSITHEKSMIIDNKSAFITAINLTRSYDKTRNFGIITEDSDVINEMHDVFLADWQNAISNTCKTPLLHAPNLIWSPVNSEERLATLIRAASYHLAVTVENLGNKKIQAALIEMASQGVDIKLIVPQCDRNENPLFNYSFINKLLLANVKIKVMPQPSSAEHPYMHSKMILVDNRIAYVGSTNFSNNSLLKARELGIVFSDEEAVQKMNEVFQKDWSVAIDPVPLHVGFCLEVN